MKDKYNKKDFINNKSNKARRKLEIMIIIPSDTLYYASQVLTGNSFKVFVTLAGQMDGFSLSVQQLTERTGIDKKGIYRCYDELSQKGFIQHNKYKTIEVLYPIDDSGILTTIPDAEIPKCYNDSTQNAHYIVPKMPTIDSGQNGEHNKYINNRINKYICSETFQVSEQEDLLLASQEDDASHHNKYESTQRKEHLHKGMLDSLFEDELIPKEIPKDDKELSDVDIDAFMDREHALLCLFYGVDVKLDELTYSDDEYNHLKDLQEARFFKPSVLDEYISLRNMYLAS